jgi:hypothetical protein
MTDNLTPDIIKQAKTPHELFMINLALFHLLATPASIALDIGLWGFIVPLACSLVFIGYTGYRSQQHERHELIHAHWQLARKHTYILLIGYGITGVILLLATVIAASSAMGHIMMVALSRVAVVPVVLVMLICFVLESSALAQAAQGNIPKK